MMSVVRSFEIGVVWLLLVCVVIWGIVRDDECCKEFGEAQA